MYSYIRPMHDSKSLGPACPAVPLSLTRSNRCIPVCNMQELSAREVHCTGIRKGKERKRIYIAPFIYYVYLKALRHGSHSFTCKYTMPAYMEWVQLRGCAQRL